MASFQMDLEDMEKAQAERPGVKQTKRGSAAKLRAMKLVGGEGDYQDSLNKDIDDDCDGRSFDNSSRDSFDEDIPDMMIRSQAMSFPSSDFTSGEGEEHRVSIQETFLVPKTSLDVVDLEASADVDASRVHLGKNTSERKRHSGTMNSSFLARQINRLNNNKLPPLAEKTMDKQDSDLDVVPVTGTGKLFSIMIAIFGVVAVFWGLTEGARPSNRASSGGSSGLAPTISMAGSGTADNSKELFGVLDVSSPSLSTPGFTSTFSSSSPSAFPDIVLSCEVSFDTREFDHALLSHHVRKRMHDLPVSLGVDESSHGIFSCDSSNLAISFLALDTKRYDLHRLRTRYALAVIFLELGGPNWSPHRSLWLSTENECRWEGVSCRHNKLISLALNNTALSGRIPPQIGMLSNMGEFDLSNNAKLSRDLPPELAKLKNLEKLKIDHDLVINSPLCNEISKVVEDLTCGDGVPNKAESGTAL